MVKNDDCIDVPTIDEMVSVLFMAKEEYVERAGIEYKNPFTDLILQRLYLWGWLAMQRKENRRFLGIGKKR